MSSSSWGFAQPKAVMCSSETIGSWSASSFVVEFDDRARQGRAGFESETLAQRTGGDIADHNFEWDNLNFANELFAHVHAANEVRGNAQPVELGEDEFGNAVVEDALAVEHLVLCTVTGRGYHP